MGEKKSDSGDHNQLIISEKDVQSQTNKKGKKIQTRGGTGKKEKVIQPKFGEKNILGNATVLGFPWLGDIGKKGESKGKKTN